MKHDDTIKVLATLLPEDYAQKHSFPPGWGGGFSQSKETSKEIDGLLTQLVDKQQKTGKSATAQRQSDDWLESVWNEVAGQRDAWGKWVLECARNPDELRDRVKKLKEEREAKRREREKRAAERKKREEEEAERQRLEAEARREARRKREEERKKREEEEAERQRLEAEARREARRKREEERKKREEEEAEKQKLAEKEEEARREARREEQERREAEEAEKQRLAEKEAAARRKARQRALAKRRAKDAAVIAEQVSAITAAIQEKNEEKERLRQERRQRQREEAARRAQLQRQAEYEERRRRVEEERGRFGWAIVLNVVIAAALLCGLWGICHGFDVPLAKTGVVWPWCWWHIKCVIGLGIVFDLTLCIVAAINPGRRDSIPKDRYDDVVSPLLFKFFVAMLLIIIGMFIYAVCHLFNALGFSLRAFGVGLLFAGEFVIVGFGGVLFGYVCNGLLWGHYEGD